MRRALIATVALAPLFMVQSAAAAAPSIGPAPSPLSVTCWFGSDPKEHPADRVYPQGGALRIEYRGVAQLTTVPCIARIPIAVDPVVFPPVGVYCLDHAGDLTYKGEALNQGFADGVVWWIEKDYDLGYVQVFSTAQCWIGSEIE